MFVLCKGTLVVNDKALSNKWGSDPLVPSIMYESIIVYFVVLVFFCLYCSVLIGLLGIGDTMPSEGIVYFFSAYAAFFAASRNDEAGSFSMDGLRRFVGDIIIKSSSPMHDLASFGVILVLPDA